MIFKNLFRRKTRTLLTVAGITMGVAVIVALGAVAEGLQSGYMAMFSRSGADLVVLQKGSYEISLSAISEDMAAQLGAWPEVSATTGMLVGYVTAPNMPRLNVFGYDLNSFAIKRFQVVEGRPLSGARSTASNREVLIGREAARATKLGVGDSIRLLGSAYRIVGIFETGSGFEDGGAVISQAEAQQLLQKPRQVNAVQVKLKDPRQADQVRAKLERLYPRLSVSQSAQLASTQQLVSVVQGLGLGIALLAILIGGVGMTNTVMMSTFERTREIGTLRALGWSRARVLLLILGESALLGGIGGLIGCAVGAAIVGVVRSMPSLAYLDSQVTPTLLLQGMFTALVLGGIGGIYPAWWASRLMPVEALRYEGGVTNTQSLVSNLQLRIGDWKLEILKTLARRRGRTALTVIGIGIALAAIVVLSGMLGGFVVVYTEIGMAGGTDLMVWQANLNDFAYSVITDRTARQIAAMPGVKSATGMTTDIVTTREIPYLLVRGYDPQGPLASHFRVVAGRELLGSHDLILGRPAAEALKLNVGDVARFGETAYRVVGIFETGVGWEDACGLVSLQDAQTQFGKPHQVGLLAVKLNDPQQARAVRDQIKRAFPDLDAAISAEFAESLPDLARVKGLAIAISLLAILVGGIGMMNTMMMSMFERTREIGTLRALGWRRRRVLAMVLKESIALSVLSAVAGVALAVVLRQLVKLIPMFGSMIPVVISPEVLLQALAVAIALGAVGGLYPAWRAANLRPVEALRYE